MPTAERYDELAAEGGKHAQLFKDMAAWCREQKNPLNPTENRIAKMLRDGVVREDVAIAMKMSGPMVSKHVAKIWQHMGVIRRNDAALVYQLAARGWLL